MKKEWLLTRPAFDHLLSWLDSDHEQAALKYERIRHTLVRIFVCRGCTFAEDLVDETFNRATTKAAEFRTSYVGDPALYLYRIAQNVYLEFLRQRSSATLTPGPAAHAPTNLELEQEYRCLDSCMGGLAAHERQLILAYYQFERRAKIVHRERLAMQLGIGVNALRIRAHRIRTRLEKCVQDCCKKVQNDAWQ